MDTPHIPTAPIGYTHDQHLFADFAQRQQKSTLLLLILANFIALIPLAIGIILLWLPYQFYLHLNTPYALFPTLDVPLIGQILLGGLIFFSSILLHEWLHGIALQLMGHEAHYAFHKLFLTATIANGDHLSRQEYLWMTVTPLISMTISGGILLLFLPPVIGKLVLIALLLNTAASIGDLMVAWRVYQAPKNAVFTDDNGIQLFLPKQL